MPVGLQLMVMTLGMPLRDLRHAHVADVVHPNPASSAGSYFLYGASNLGSLAALLGYPGDRPVLPLPARPGYGPPGMRCWVD